MYNKEKTTQMNHFMFEVEDRHATLGKILSYIFRRTRKIMYEADLYENSDMNLIVDAISSSLKRGENVRAYFISGEQSKGFLIKDDKTKSIPTNEYYSKFHPVGNWTYQDAMSDINYGELVL